MSGAAYAAGVAYVADEAAGIRRITAAGEVSTYGSPRFAGKVFAARGPGGATRVYVLAHGAVTGGATVSYVEP